MFGSVFNEQGEPRRPLLKILDTLYLPYEPDSRSVFEAAKSLLRKEGVERKDVSEKNLSYEQKTAILAALDELGFIKEVRPECHECDDILLLGSYADEMKFRMEYLVDLYNKGLRFKRLFFLTGQRPRDLSYESDRILFFNKKAYSPCTSVQKEAAMMPVIWNQIDKPKELAEITPIIIDVQRPSKAWRRGPNTYDTLKALMEGGYDLAGRTYLAISIQPYVHYQHALLCRVLPPSYKGATVGPAAHKHMLFSQYFDTLARAVHNEYWSLHPEIPPIN